MDTPSFNKETEPFQWTFYLMVLTDSKEKNTYVMLQAIKIKKT